MGALTRNQENQLGEIRQEFGSRMKAFEAALPSHIKPERFLRTVMTALTVSPKLMGAPVDTLLNECMRAAQDGLMPDGKEAALVPRGYGDKFTIAYQPMIAGIRKKARNSGEISTWDTVVACENDVFIVQHGDDPKITHEVNYRKPRGGWFAVYSVCVLKDGTRSFEVMTKDEVYAIRDRSDGYKAFKDGKIRSNPWASDEVEMARKTVARRHSKVIPMSSDLDRLVFSGAEHEGPTIDYGDVTAAAGGRKEAQSIANRLDQLADGEKVDPQTGELSPGDDGAKEGKDDDGPDPVKVAREDGAQARRDGKAKRQMPAKYRNEDALAEAWVEGWTEASEKGDER